MSDEENAVLHGLPYAKKQAGWLTVTVMSRDTIEAFPSQKQNIKGLVSFFSRFFQIIRPGLRT
jgi:hypothetical protein